MRKAFKTAVFLIFSIVFCCSSVSAGSVTLETPITMGGVIMDGSDKTASNNNTIRLYINRGNPRINWSIYLAADSITGQNTGFAIPIDGGHNYLAQNPRIERAGNPSDNPNRITLNLNSLPLTSPGARICFTTQPTRGKYRYLADSGSIRISVPADTPADTYTIILNLTFTPDL